MPGRASPTSAGPAILRREVVTAFRASRGAELVCQAVVQPGREGPAIRETR